MVKILVVEDSKSLNSAIKSLLEEKRFKCTSAFSLQDAKKNLDKEAYDYIILDLHLEDAQGEELVDKINSYKDSKIIVLTSSEDEEIRSKLFVKGILDFLNKKESIEDNINEIVNFINDIEKNKENSILIIDDSTVIQKQLQDILTPRGYKLYSSMTGIEAYQILKKENIDLVILDLELPDIHGLKLLKNIKKNINKNLSVVVLSGNYDAKTYRESLKQGASDFIKKPFLLEEVLLKVEIQVNSIRKDIEINRNVNLLNQYKETVDLTNIVSKADINGNITYVNKKFEEISGYKKEELVGKPHSIVRHPDMGKEFFKDLWKTIKENKKPWVGKLKNKTKKGSTYYVDTVINPILDKNGNIIEFIGIRRDITKKELKKVQLREKYLIKSEEFDEVLRLSEYYEKAMDKSSIIIRVSKDFKIIYVNDNFSKMTGYTKDELVNLHYSKIIHKDNDVINMLRIVDEIKINGLWKGKLKGFHKNGKELHFITTIVPIKDRNDETIEYMAVRNDITKVEELHKELENTQKEIIYKMGEIAETRSKETGNHVKRVAEYSKFLALKAGLDEETAQLLNLASPMHDIGKIGIPDSILNKPGKFTAEEYEHMKEHANIGYNLLNTSDRKIFKAAAIIANEHHEKWDGTGYPRGLKGEEIHVFGRITAICDVFDALAHDRVYKKAWPLEKILKLLKEEKGKHFDPNLINLFFDNLDEFLELKKCFKD
ncbi:response regulator receiver protein [Arcobacter sp. CECT 8986]|uniref:response regulator n=1 Tax=Arcobacter sp. CECT 8986 TaxID=2044507 RepID=UPI001009975C|nr:response regulator [Arcobacter sp. CECT 8986]RXJ97790.1 response regulator receiver protein [Arcobacter sp. CECT 8986]